jgi:hypothetical protein
MANVTGQITLNQLSLLEVDADPAVAAGTPAPIGSRAFFNSGTIGTSYLKVGAADTAWNISTVQASALTSGSITFTNTSGYLSQNNASLFWDQTNNRIGIGTNTPLRPLSVAASTASGDSGAFVDGYGANATALTLRRANGTIGSPTAVTSGQVMAEFDAIGYGTSQFAPNQTGSIAFIAAETFTNTANGTHIAFYTAPIGSITEAERLRIHASGRVLVGTTVDDGSTELQVAGQISATDAIRPGNSTDTTNGNIRFNGLGFDFYRGAAWRDLSFPKYNFDDFNWATIGAGGNQFDWASTVANGGTTTINAAAASGDPIGIITIATGTTNNNTGTAAISAFNNVNKISLGTGPTTIEWRVRVPVLSTAGITYEVRLGIQDTVTTGDPTNGVYFVYSSGINAGQWQGITRSASTSTTVNSAVAIAINTWYKVRAEVNATRTNVDFYVDSGSGYTLIGSSTTNIPLATAVMRPVAKVNKIGGNTATSSLVNLDWCWWVQER